MTEAEELKKLLIKRAKETPEIVKKFKYEASYDDEGMTGEEMEVEFHKSEKDE